MMGQCDHLRYRSPDMLYERVVEVEAQVVLPLGSETNQRNGSDAANSVRFAVGSRGSGGGRQRQTKGIHHDQPGPSFSSDESSVPCLHPPGFTPLGGV